MRSITGHTMSLLFMLASMALLLSTITAGTITALESSSVSTISTIAAAPVISNSVDVVPTLDGSDGLNISPDSSTAPQTQEEADALFSYMLEKRGFDPKLLVTWELRCDTSDAANFPRPKGTDPYDAGLMLRDCQGWWACNTAGEIYLSVRNAPPRNRRSWQRAQYETCLELCRCTIVDKPWWHYAENYGCVKPKGGWVKGGIGLSSRDDGAPVDIGDGYSMQAHHGPARKMEQEDDGKH